MVKHKKYDLVRYIEKLRQRIEEIESISSLRKWVETFERGSIKSQQYIRLVIIEISGVPERVKDADIEKESIALLKKIGVKDLDPSQVQACHRLRKSRNIIQLTLSNPNLYYPNLSIIRTNSKSPSIFLKKLL